MIRFQCEHCAHKISVQNKHAGKRVKCQKCGSVGTVPVKSTIIDFHCESCGQKISVPQVHAGKKCKCPKCKSIVVVPTRPETPAKSVSTVRFTCSTCNQEIEEPETSRGKLVECPHCSSYVPVPSEKIPAQKAEVLVQPGKADDISDERFEELQRGKGKIAVHEPEPAAERKLPWIIDILLYPLSLSGLIHLAIFIGTPMLILILWMTLPVELACLFRLITIIARILLYLYLYWYLAECIRDSAGGWVRAPQGFGGIPVISDMFGQMVNILGCFGVFMGPFFLYTIIVKDINVISWLLISLAIFFYPMGLLSVVLHNSARGFNLRLIFNSITKTILPYLGIVLFIIMPAMLIWIIPMHIKGSLFSNFILHFAVVYILMIESHLLGRFYWRYQEKLNWEV